MTLVRADGIQPYWYVHIYTGLVALLDRIQSSFSIITISTNALNLWLPAHTECHRSDTKLLSAGPAHPAQPQVRSESMLDRFVKAAA